jgi:hypothetical protein
MLHAAKLYTDTDLHVEEGTLAENDRTDRTPESISSPSTQKSSVAPLRDSRAPEHFAVHTVIARSLFGCPGTRIMHVATTLKAVAITAVMSSLATVPLRADPAISSLAGAWTLIAADVLHPGGTRASDYGAAPKGLLLIDGEGHYSLQIFKAERPRFATGDKLAGTEAEYKAAVLGSSTHFGTISVDAAAGTLTFKIDAASFPNWEGAAQTRRYQLLGDELIYRVPPRPDGDTPISVWRRLK